MPAKSCGLLWRLVYTMMGFSDHARERSFPELLAAYVDGELDAPGRALVERWLAEHPEAHAELDHQRQLARANKQLWQQCQPSLPSETSWSLLLSNVQHSLPAEPPQLPPASLHVRPNRPVKAVVAAAAAIALAVMLLRPDGQLPVGTSNLIDEPGWVVADAADIEIQSIQEIDAELLVVGLPPLMGTVVLAAVGEVTLEKVARDADGMMPPAMVGGPNVPMLVVPMAGR